MIKTINVAIVEDNRDLRESLRTLIASKSGFRCMGIYDCAPAAIAGIPIDIPDVVLMDINMPRMTGIEAVRQLKESFPAVCFVMCTIFDDDENIFLSLKAGASGYILKSSSSSEIIAAIKDVNEGGAPMSATIAKRVIESFHQPIEKITPKHATLSSREIEILHLLSRGLLGKEVAARLDLSVQTIRNHCTSIYEKLQVNTKLEAINIVFGKNR